jgi:hypothetical protein
LNRPERTSNIILNLKAALFFCKLQKESAEKGLGKGGSVFVSLRRDKGESHVFGSRSSSQLRVIPKPTFGFPEKVFSSPPCQPTLIFL